MSDEEEVQEIEESTSDDKEQDHCVSHGIHDDCGLGERHDHFVDNVTHIVLPQWRTCKHISTRISRTGAGANTVCLVVESAAKMDEEILVKIR